MAEATNTGVRYGISNIHYAILDESTGTHGSYKAIPGAAKLTLTPKGSSNTVYYDNVPFEAFEANGGYDVSLELANVPDEALIDLLGYKKDSNGAIYEPASVKPIYAALAWQFDGSKVLKRGELLKVKFSRPTEEGNTKTDSVNPDNTTLPGAALVHELTINSAKENVVKASATDQGAQHKAFDKWFDKVYLPGSTIE